VAERDDEPEGWGVHQRVAYLAAAAMPVVLLAIVLAAGWAYARWLEPLTRQPVKTFPAPGIETFIHDGSNDPPRARPSAKTDPAVEVAKQAVLANGAAGWGE
jgi:hypothetical protein